MLVDPGSGVLDYKTFGFFFLKISKEIGKAWRKSLARFARDPHTPVGRVRREEKNLFSLVPDLLFDCERVVEYAKKGTVLQSRGEK